MFGVIVALGFVVEEHRRTNAAYGADGTSGGLLGGGCDGGDDGGDNGSLRPDKYRPVFFVARRLSDKDIRSSF